MPLESKFWCREKKQNVDVEESRLMRIDAIDWTQTTALNMMQTRAIVDEKVIEPSIQKGMPYIGP